MGNQALVFGSLPICKDAFGWYYSVEVKATRYQRGEFDDLCGSHGSCDCLEGRDIFFLFLGSAGKNRHIIPLCCHQRDAQAQALLCHGHLQDMHLFETTSLGDLIEHGRRGWAQPRKTASFTEFHTVVAACTFHAGPTKWNQMQFQNGFCMEYIRAPR